MSSRSRKLLHDAQNQCSINFVMRAAVYVILPIMRVANSVISIMRAASNVLSPRKYF
jgi:hypothetical protein